MERQGISRKKIIIDLNDANPDPKGTHLEFSKMAQNNNQIENMKANYMTMEVISTRIKADGLRDYLEFDNTGKYQFLTCENCDGPMLDHIMTKCIHMIEGESYDERTIAKFENWLKRIPELRKKIEERAVLEVDRQAQTQAEVMSRAMRDAAAAS